MAIEVTSDIAGLRRSIVEAGPKELRLVLEDLVNNLHNNRGTLETWENWRTHKKREEIWATQEKLSWISRALFYVPEMEDEVKKLYKAITEKQPSGVDYSCFFLQLTQNMHAVSHHPYGAPVVPGGDPFYFCDYVECLDGLNHLLSIGPMNMLHHDAHKGILALAAQKASTAPEER